MGADRGSQKESGSHFFQTFGAGKVPLEYVICKDKLFLVIDCFRNSGKLQQVQLPKTIEKFDLRAKVSKKTFISLTNYFEALTYLSP